MKITVFFFLWNTGFEISDRDRYIFRATAKNIGSIGCYWVLSADIDISNRCVQFVQCSFFLLFLFLIVYRLIEEAFQLRLYGDVKNTRSVTKSVIHFIARNGQIISRTRKTFCNLAIFHLYITVFVTDWVVRVTLRPAHDFSSHLYRVTRRSIFSLNVFAFWFFRKPVMNE